MQTMPPTTPLEETPEVRYAMKPKAGVFYPALAVILIFVVLAMAMPEQFAAFVESGNTAVVNGLGWYYVLLVTGFVFFSVWIAVGRRGDVVLGKDDEIIMCFSTAKALGAEAKRTVKLERAAFRRELLEEIRENDRVT